MAINDRLKRFLDSQGIRYQVVPHREVFTAQEVAATSDVPGRQVAKVVVVRGGDGAPMLVVLPAPCRVSLPALERASGRRGLALATEGEFGGLFPDCETGAMPPFGNLWGLPVYADACFPRDRAFVFQGGNHREVVEMSYPDYDRLVQPVTGAFCVRAAAAA